MSKPKIYVTRLIAQEGLKELQQVCEMHMWEQKEIMPRDVQFQLFADCTGLLTTTDIIVDRELLEACPNLQVVSNHAVGFDNIDVPVCTEFGIPVGNTPGVLSETTADLAFTLILATARRITELADRVKKDVWAAKTGMLDNLGTDVHHTTLGIIGMGSIGREVARRAAGFNMTVLYHNRKRHKSAEKEFGVTYAEREDILRQSDFISLHLPLSHETKHYIGVEEFGLMKRSAIIVNTARGAIIDQAALLEALRSGEIAGAGLDVTDPEPTRGDDPLLDLPQAIVVPHIGSGTYQTRIRMSDMAAQNIVRTLRGKPMLSCVNPEAIGKGRSAPLFKQGSGRRGPGFR